jgi:hypothetical protein
MRSVNYKGYTIFEDGRILGLKGYFLKPGLASNGYYTIVICENGKHTTKCIHRLLAESFIQNPHGYNVVNHINSDRTDNRLENLEWVTFSGNSQHAFKSGRCEATRRAVSERMSRPVIDTLTGKRFTSVKLAAEHIGMKSNTLVGYLIGKRPNKTNFKYEHI